MTDDELFIKSLTNFRNQCAEELAENKRTDGLNAECVEYYEAVVQGLDEVLPHLSGIDSLYEVVDGEPLLDEETFSFIIECLEDYSEVFIVDGRNEDTLKQTEEIHSQLADILFEFYDDDEFEDDDFDDEDVEDDE